MKSYKRTLGTVQPAMIALGAFVVLVSHGETARPMDVKLATKDRFEPMNPKYADLMNSPDRRLFKAQRNFGKLIHAQRLFWRELGGVDPDALSPELRSRYELLLLSNPVSDIRELNFRVLPHCLYEGVKTAEIVISRDGSDICIEVNTLSDQERLTLILPAVLLARGGGMMKISDFKAIMRMTKDPGSSRYREYQARFRVGASTSIAPSEDADCQLVFGDESLEDVPFHEATETFAVRKDFASGYVLKGRTPEGHDFFGRCASR